MNFDLTYIFPGQSSDATLRERILFQTWQLIDANTYSGITTEEIAKSLAISKKTLYKEFRSKEEILLEIVVRVIEKVSTIIDEITLNPTIDFVEKIHSYINFTAQIHEQFAKKSLLLDIQRNAPKVWTALNTFSERRIHSIYQFLLNGRENGYVRQDLQLDIVAYIYIQTILNIKDSFVLESTAINTDELYSLFVNIIYTGLFSDVARSEIITSNEIFQYSQSMRDAVNVLENPESPDEQTKARIITQAMNFFLQFGFSRVTMDEIAREVGISKKTLYKYFASKEELLSQVLQRTQDSALCAHKHVNASTVNEYVVSIYAFTEFMSLMVGKISQQFSRDLLLNAKEYWNEMAQWRLQSIEKMMTIFFEHGQNINALVTSPETANNKAVIYRVIIDSVFNPEAISHSHYSNSEIYKTIFQIVFYGLLTPEGRQRFVVANHQ